VTLTRGFGRANTGHSGEWKRIAGNFIREMDKGRPGYQHPRILGEHFEAEDFCRNSLLWHSRRRTTG
jgi:hypothetical protein